MSYLSAPPGTLVAHLWPDSLAATIVQYFGADDISETHVLPSTLERLVEYIDLANDPEIANPWRNKCIVYKPIYAPDLESLWSVACRLHGFLEHVQISTFGNWNG